MIIHFPNKQRTAIIKKLLQAGLDAADPGVALQKCCQIKRDTLQIGRRRYNLNKYKRIVCIGAGKASARMMIALQQLLGNRLEEGLIVVKDLPKHPLKKCKVYEAGHPTPDSRSLYTAKTVQQLVRSLTNQDLLIVLLSGGASSLLTAPAQGLTLRDKQHTTKCLLRSGANIQEINTVRKHLSTIKGGQLATSSSARIIGLILSDVFGDDLATIGSGLTAPDPSTFLQTRLILEKYGLWNHVPGAVTNHVEKGMRGIIPETLKPRDLQLKRVQNVIIGNNKIAIKHIAKMAKQLGFYPYVQKNTLQGEAKEIGNHIALLAKNIDRRKKAIRRPACIIWGGEPTVTVTGRGNGGRAQECALSAAMGMAGLPNMIMAGLGTDGSDGPTDMAGAVIDGRTIARAEKKKINAVQVLTSHNSYSFFQKVGGHINTGPTGTNVNDIYLLLAL